MSYNDYYPPQAPQRYQQPYRDHDDFDPYNSNPPAHPTYDQSGYRDAVELDDEAYPNNRSTAPQPRGSPPGADEYTGTKETSRYAEAGFPPVLRPPKESGGIRLWRQDYHGNLWSKGGRGRCVGRFCCCTILITLFLLVSIVLTLIIWIRPPSVAVNNVAFPTNGSTFQVTSTSLNINLGVNISVSNPNFFSIDLSKIKVDLTYPLSNLDVGGGEKDNIVFKSHTQTTFNFPFTLTYNEASDTNKVVLSDLLSRCGVTGPKRNLDIKYKITLGIKILFVTIDPSFSDDFSFACPVDAADLQSLLNGSGITVPGVNGA